MSIRMPQGHGVSFARIVVIVAATLLAVGIMACGSSSGGGTGDDSKLSSETRAYLDSAMPALEQVMAEWQAGKATKAAKEWKAIGDIPETTTMDYVIGKDYLKYANDVRYYMVGDGSATLKDVEDAKANAEASMAGQNL